MKEIKSIQIVFENCEAFTVPVEHLKIFGMDNIKNSLFFCNSESIYRTTTAQHTRIMIHPYANVISNMSPGFSDSKFPFERINRYNDITHVNIQYTDQTSEYIAVRWEGESNQFNSYQKVDFDSKGNCYIVISKTKTVDDVFEIRNED